MVRLDTCIRGVGGFPYSNIIIIVIINIIIINIIINININITTIITIIITIMKVQSFLLSHVLLHSTQALSLPGDVHAALTTRTDFKKPSIEWSKCDLDFGNVIFNKLQSTFDCATLEVPLDYTNSSDGRTVKLDLIRAKATKKPFKGSVLFNPGGPGVSGVESVVLGAAGILP